MTLVTPCPGQLWSVTSYKDACRPVIYAAAGLYPLTTEGRRVVVDGQQEGAEKNNAGAPDPDVTAQTHQRQGRRRRLLRMSNRNQQRARRRMII